MRQSRRVAAAPPEVRFLALLVLAGPRITPLALALVVGVMIVATSCLVASATTSAGAMLAGYAYVWLTVYSALFLPPRATQAHALMIGFGFGLGLLIDDFSATFTAWLLVSGTVWVSGLTLSGLSARVRRQAETDDLTGLLNRRAFTAAAGREHELAARTGADLTVVLIDLDGFKAVNDREGHLRAASSRLSAPARA